MLKSKPVNVIQVQDWDKLVEETYQRPYSFQQQNGCQSRGTFSFSVPYEYGEDFEKESIPEEVNGREMGVSFKAWLARDPKKPIVENGKIQPDYCNTLFWDRNFYPSVEMVIQDLHKRGLLADGDYLINIDW